MTYHIPCASLPAEISCADGVGSPTSDEEYAAYQKAMSNFISACTRDSTPAGIMEHVGTKEVIQDWDIVRAALGYDKIHFAGMS